MLRRSDHREEQDILGDIQISCMQHRWTQLLHFSFSHLMTQWSRWVYDHFLWKQPEGEVSLLLPCLAIGVRTYCNVVSHDFWDFIIHWINDDVEGDVGGAMFSIWYAEYELVSCGFHPLVSGLYIVNMTLNDVFVRKRGWGEEEIWTNKTSFWPTCLMVVRFTWNAYLCLCLCCFSQSQDWEGHFLCSQTGEEKWDWSPAYPVLCPRQRPSGGMELFLLSHLRPL